MPKKLSVRAVRIHCIDPQDPFMDELYFITGSVDASHTSVTTRRIKKGFNEAVDIKLLDTEIDETRITPVQITLWEQRALRDDGKAAEMLQSLAKQGAEFAKKHMDGLSWSQIAVQVAGWLLENATSFFKRIFRDSPLGSVEIVVPRVGKPGEDRDFPTAIDGEYEYQLTAAGKKGSPYRYVVDIAVKIGASAG